MLLVPVYLVLPDYALGPMNAPELALDRLVPLQPAWGLGYGTAYLFLILLPVFVVREREHVRRTFVAYLAVWLSAYVVFVVYPTEAPRPAEVPGEGFFAWGLRFLYDADPPYNCFPSLHVAHSFVSALTVRRLHRSVGNVALACACLVGLSTLFTKQHYVADVVAGVAMACAAGAIFLRHCPGDGAEGTGGSPRRSPSRPSVSSSRATACSGWRGSRREAPRECRVRARAPRAVVYSFTGTHLT